ncbi:hypothetical protein ABIF38_008504 [Bradyrhizobium japonicum]|nr:MULTISPECIES: hypothetical protein [Bradyrhizobium]MCP1729183.1 hypothetical protein [Bradyrhizobium elkanii]MCS3573312.1 hypothetical protein [Bradyrhizobium elkanii]MCS3593997.1 hypothetical protein [Bradyrhizobium elkanii]MCS3623443.1 hypothetical protein [Bradyrhizobium elkanii]WFU31098.1 hypothetical protein QA635_31680 [Bradyrhizobium australafricanum]
MLEQPHFDPYSIPARVCLAIAIFGGSLLIAVLLLTALIAH